MKDFNSLIKKGYAGVKVTSMLNAVLSSEIKPHLRLVQLDELYKIKAHYEKLKYITNAQMTLLFNVYYNFVLLDFRFEDKTKKILLPTKLSEAKPQHIGMKILKQMQKQNTCKTCGKETNKVYCSEKCYSDND